MGKIVDENIRKNIEETVDSWDFDSRRKSNPDGCMCYQENKKCHEIEKLNCLFCYCPNYDRTITEGGCKINNPNGKYSGEGNKKIWDCSDCDFPHIKENAIKLFGGLFK